MCADGACGSSARRRSEEHTSELQSRGHLVCRPLLEKKKFGRNQVVKLIIVHRPVVTSARLARLDHARQSLHILPFFFFFNDTATTEIYTLSLHDALPISSARR